MSKDASQLLRSMQDLPPLPAVATRVIALVQDRRTTVEDLATVVSTDQALTAKLIRMSNSAYYGFGRRCASTRDAIQLLGFFQVRQIAMASSLMAMFDGPEADDAAFDSDLFWAHSLTVAVAAESIARATRMPKPDDAFTAGILHDLGRLVIRHALPALFHKAAEVALNEGIPFHEAETRVTGYTHEQVGEAVARRWRFPTRLTAAITNHHDGRLTREKDGLAGLVAQCNRLVLHYGLTCGLYENPEVFVPLPPDLEALEALAGGFENIASHAALFMDKTFHPSLAARPKAA